MTMLESAIRTEIYHTLAMLGFNPYHPMDQGRTRTGRPDLFGMNTMGPDVVVEVKKIVKLKTKPSTFDPTSISNGQRRWLDWWCWGREGQGYLAVGTTWHPRRLWFIPWMDWVEAEKFWFHDQGIFYIPNIEDFDKQFSAFECERKWRKIFEDDKVAKVYWEVPENVAIHKIATKWHRADQWQAHSTRYIEGKKASDPTFRLPEPSFDNTDASS